MKKVKKLVIPIKKWLHGRKDSVKHPEGSRLLRRSDGKMCCMGIYLAACGVSEDKLLDRTSPSHLHSRTEVPRQAEWLLDKSEHKGESGEYIEDLFMNANDDRNGPKRCKNIPRTIKRLFKRYEGIEVEFSNE